MSVIDEILAERQRQIDEEGWTLEHDDTHKDQSLAIAAACYAAPAPIFQFRQAQGSFAFIDPWPWTVCQRGEPIRALTAWYKKDKPRRRQLVVAAALIVAEIERLDRLKETTTEN